MTALPVAPNESPYGKYLTTADVEKITGLEGITRKEIALALEFYRGEHEKILEAVFNSPSFYKTEVEKNWDYYTAVPEIGERAGLAISSMPYRITFLQGKFCVMVQTPLEGGKTLLNIDQLLAVSKMIAGRLLMV